MVIFKQTLLFHAHLQVLLLKCFEMLLHLWTLLEDRNNYEKYNSMVLYLTRSDKINSSLNYHVNNDYNFKHSLYSLLCQLWIFYIALDLLYIVQASRTFWIIIAFPFST